MNIDASQNYLVWSNTEAVTFGSKSSQGTSNYFVPIAKRRAPTYKELAASNGAYTGQDLVWLLPNALLPAGAKPKPGDPVTDADGTKWTTLEVAWNALKATWRMVTRNLVLAYQLRALIDIQRPAITYDGAAGVLRGWPDDASPSGSVAYAAVPAKVQLITQETQEVFGVLGLQGNYAVTVGQDVAILKVDRVKWNSPTGTVYLDILGQRNPQRIDELPLLDCASYP